MPQHDLHHSALGDWRIEDRVLFHDLMIAADHPSGSETVQLVFFGAFQVVHPLAR